MCACTCALKKCVLLGSRPYFCSHTHTHTHTTHTYKTHIQDTHTHTRCICMLHRWVHRRVRVYLEIQKRCQQIFRTLPEECCCQSPRTQTLIIHVQDVNALLCACSSFPAPHKQSHGLKQMCKPRSLALLTPECIKQHDRNRIIQDTLPEHLWS